MIQRIEISFPVEVALPDGWERALDGLVGMVCEAYQRANPTRVMWPSGRGALPLGSFYSGGDGTMFDDSVFVIQAAEREDYYGENPHNPESDSLRKAASEASKAQKAERKAKIVEPAIEALLAAAGSADGNIAGVKEWIAGEVAKLREKAAT